MAVLAAWLAKKGFSPHLFSEKTVGIRRSLRIHEPSLCHSVAAPVYLQQQLPVAGFVLFSNWVGISSLNRQENENNWLKIPFKIIIKEARMFSGGKEQWLMERWAMWGKEVTRFGECWRGEKISGMLWGKSCLFTGSVYPHLWVRNAVIWGVAPYYKKVKHQADLIKSSLQETISISMPSFMQIH